MLNGHAYNEDFQDCLDILQPQDISDDKNYKILANGDGFCDFADEKYNTPYVQKLLQDIEKHRIKEKQLQDKLEEMKKMGDVYIKNIIDGDRQFSSDLLDLESSSNHENYDETNDPLSSRSDKSIVSIANSTTLQAALDVFAENNKLLIDKESSEQQIIRLNNELQESNSRILGQEIQNKTLLDENLNLKSEIDRLFKRSSPQFDNDQDENLILHVRDLETDLELKDRRLEIVMKEKIDLQQEFATLNNKFNDIRAEKIALSDQVKELLNQKASFQSKIDQLKISNQSREQESNVLENLRSENIDLEEKSKIQTIKFRELNNEFEDLRTKLRIKVEEVEHLKSVLVEKSKRNFSAEYESAKRECSKLEQECRKLIEENNDFRSQLKSAEELKRALDSQTLGVENLKEVLQSKNADLKQMQSKISQLERKTEEQEVEKQDLSKSIRTLEDRLEEKFRGVVNLQKEFEQYQANAEMQFQDTCSTYETKIVEKEQKISDLETLLRKHIEYPGKFDSILSTASSTIQNKVCDKNSSTSDLLGDEDFLTETREIISHLFDLLRNLVESGVENLAEIEGTIAKFEFSEVDFRKICDDLENMIGIVNSIFDENKNLNDLLDKNRKQIDDAAKYSTNLEQNLESTSKELSILKQEYEKSLKILRKELKREQNSKLELEEKCRNLDDLIKMKGDLERKFEDLNRQKTISEFLEKQSNETIKDLLQQHDEDKKSIDYLSAEITKLRLTSEQNAVREVHFRNLNENYNRLDEISKSLRHENNSLKIALHRFRYYRSMLKDQKLYLQKNVDHNREMVDEILEFLRVNHFSTPRFTGLLINHTSNGKVAKFDAKKNRKTTSFKSVGLVILAYVIWNKRYRDCLNLRFTFSIDKHDSFL